MSEPTEADCCQRPRKWIDEGQDGIVLAVSFVLDGRIDGRVPGYAFPLFILRRYAGKWDYA